MAFLDVLQKPREAFALEVESRGNVLVDLVAWELIEHLRLLAREVVCFLGADIH